MLALGDPGFAASLFIEHRSAADGFSRCRVRGRDRGVDRRLVTAASAPLDVRIDVGGALIMLAVAVVALFRLRRHG